MKRRGRGIESLRGFELIVVAFPTKGSRMVELVIFKMVECILVKVHLMPQILGLTKIRGQTPNLNDEAWIIKLFPLTRNM